MFQSKDIFWRGFFITHGQQTDEVPSWMNALLLAKLLTVEEVAGWFAASVPEPGTTTVAHVVVPLHLEVCAAVVVRRQVAGLARQIRAACVERTLGRTITSWTATIAGRGATTALTIRTKGRGETIRATAVFVVRAEVTTFKISPLCRSLPIRTATIRLRVTRTPRRTFIRCRGLLVRTTAVGRSVATTPFLGRT